MVTKIAIVGPECTGKTTLASQLAKYYSTIWIPEYAREYVSKLHIPYTYEDVENIAKVQYKQILQVDHLNNTSLVFFDTELIITKVWFELVFQRQPHWLDNAIKYSNFSLYLLTDTSIPWEADGIRENGGKKREILFTIYEKYLKSFNFSYTIINGLHNTRIQNAIAAIDQILKKNKTI